MRFGLFDFNPDTGELRKNGEVVRLQAQPARVLGMLIGRAGELVTRQEIQRQIWGDNFVEFDQGLNFCIRQIRIALNDQAETPVYIETVPRQGYRFIAPVSRPASPEPPAEAPLPPLSPLPDDSARARRPGWKLGAIFLVVIGLAAAFWVARRPAAPAAKTRRMLAVLPFDNISADPAQEPFSDGLTEELITSLSRLNPSRLGVIARTSAMRYKKEKKPVDQIRRELGIDYLIEGSVRAEEGLVRITVQLIRTDDQSHLWAESYDRPYRDILGVQREVAESVARSLALELMPGRVQPIVSANPQAREALLKGHYQLAKRNGGALQQAIEFFQQAIRLDPGYAAAHAGLAAALMRQSLSPREVQAAARASLRRALELDDALAEAHCLSGQLAMKFELNWDLARREFERAIALEPGRAGTHHEYAFYLSNLGRHDEAIARLKTSIELDPVSPLVQGDLGWLYLRAGRYDEAVEQSLKTLELEPADLGAQYCLFHALLRQGRREQALRRAQEVQRLAGASPNEIVTAPADNPDTGLTAYREWEAGMLLARGKRGYLDPAVLAMTYADLGRTEEAIQSLLQAAREGSSFLASLRAEPRYDLLRADPRFVDLLRRFFPAEGAK
ncbi:MAG: winged helix-turn-helix domain-containing protein [Blastocatellia bacterium]|nr:winged helix-turn-helix domain-containing protein [Blastocatellia bacterium]